MHSCRLARGFWRVRWLCRFVALEFLKDLLQITSVGRICYYLLLFLTLFMCDSLDNLPDLRWKHLHPKFFKIKFFRFINRAVSVSCPVLLFSKKVFWSKKVLIQATNLFESCTFLVWNFSVELLNTSELLDWWTSWWTTKTGRGIARNLIKLHPKSSVKFKKFALYNLTL